MISIQGRLFNVLLRLVQKKTLLKKQFSSNRFNVFASVEPPRKMMSSCIIDKYRLRDHNVFTLRPKNAPGQIQILYLHGGAYVQSFVWPHWRFLSQLVKELHCTVTAPDYPLAPAHTYKQSFAMVSDLYRTLIKTVRPEMFILMGDSAGGGFALALAQLMRQEGLHQPARIILLSPWLDIGLTNPEIKDIDPSDFFLGVEGLQLAGKAYAGTTNATHYLLSPIYGPLEGLGKIAIFVGSREILVADARKFKTMAEAKGIAIDYYEYPGMFHAWMLLNLPESKKTRKQIMDLIRGV